MSERGEIRIVVATTDNIVAIVYISLEISVKSNKLSLSVKQKSVALHNHFLMSSLYVLRIVSSLAFFFCFSTEMRFFVTHRNEQYSITDSIKNILLKLTKREIIF